MSEKFREWSYSQILQVFFSLLVLFSNFSYCNKNFPFALARFFHRFVRFWAVPVRSGPYVDRGHM